jgi:hypothetical protein
MKGAHMTCIDGFLLLIVGGAFLCVAAFFAIIAAVLVSMMLLNLVLFLLKALFGILVLGPLRLFRLITKETWEDYWTNPDNT